MLGSCPQVVTEHLSFAVGGGASNTCAALARMGLPVRIFGKVGDDQNGVFARESLRAAGVDTRYLRLAPGEQTPFTFVGIHPDGKRTSSIPGTDLTFTVDDLDQAALLDTDIFLYQDCWVLPKLDGAPAASLLSTAQARGILTALDATWGLGPRREVLEMLVPHCDYLLLSYADLSHLYPGLSPTLLAEHLRALGAKTVILKLGVDGALLVREGGNELVPGIPAQVVDTTGAGDCWNAGFLAALAHEQPLPVAMRIAHACAAFGIEAVGGATGVPATKPSSPARHIEATPA